MYTDLSCAEAGALWLSSEWYSQIGHDRSLPVHLNSRYTDVLRRAVSNIKFERAVYVLIRLSTFFFDLFTSLYLSSFLSISFSLSRPV
jgi:hypothetical protein